MEKEIKITPMGDFAWDAESLAALIRILIQNKGN